MIPTHVLHAILDKHGYRRLENHGRVFRYVRELNGQPSILVFMEALPRQVAIEFLVDFAHKWATPELALELETIQQRLPVLNS